MSDLGQMTYVISIEFYNFKKGLLMHQIRHVLEILKKFEMKHCNVVITPAEPWFHLSKNEHEQDVNPTQYRRLADWIFMALV